MKEYKHVLILGDLHLGDVNFNLEKELIELVKRNNFDCIIIGGDTFDIWRGNNIEQIMYEYRKVFKALKENKNVIFIKGNHDPNLEELEKSGFQVVNHYRYKTSQGKKVKVLHGHEFDKYREWFKIIGKVTSYVEERLNRLFKFFMIPIALRFVRLWFGLDRPTIWMALRKKHFIYSDSDVLVYGHTHLPMKGHIKGIEIYNWGSWQRDRGHRPSYIINKGNKFSVEYLPIKRRRLILHFISILSTIKERYKNGIIIKNGNKK